MFFHDFPPNSFFLDDKSDFAKYIFRDAHINLQDSKSRKVTLTLRLSYADESAKLVGVTGLELCSCFARRARETERIPAGILLRRLLNNPIPSMETHSVEQKLNGGRLVGVTGLEPAASKSQTKIIVYFAW